MSVRGPPPGDYYIVNSLSTPDGTQLALTNNGERAFLTVTEFNKGTYAPAQVVRPIVSRGRQYVCMMN